MRKERGITLVSLVVTIIVLIILAGVSINLVLGENGIITKSKQAKEKTEQAKLNEEIALNELYTQLEAEGGEGFNGDNSNVYIEKLAEFKKAIADYIEEAGGVKPEYTAETIIYGESIKGIVKEVTKDATATEDKILKDYTAYKDGELITGTMTDNGTLNATLNAGESFTIPTGYTTGGKITANSLASQTQATATASNITNGKTAWVNGNKITGTMTDNGAVTKSLNAGGSYTIPAGYHNGSGKVTANSLASQTQATATASDIMSGKTAWVNGSLITGNAASSKTPKFIGFFYYRYHIAGAYFIYNTKSNTIGINSKTCDNFKFVDSSDVENIQILKSGYFDIIATGKGAEQYKLMNQYIKANTTYSVPCGNYAGGEGMIVIYSY